jgi:hypothetical protein
MVIEARTMAPGNLEERNRITGIGISALVNVYENHRNLGVAGLEPLEKNQFGDTALRHLEDLV